MATLRIIKILSVEDTRTYEEIDERWVPIPGSGIENACARCGRNHEVHATVLLEDKSEAVVGTGCMNAETNEISAQMKSATSAAKTLKRQEAERVALKAKIDAYTAIQDEVLKLPVPRILSRPYVNPITVNSRPEALLLYCEGMPENIGTAICWDGDITRERRECAIYCWREWQMHQRGAVKVHACLRDLDRRIARTKARAKALVEVSPVQP